MKIYTEKELNNFSKNYLKALKNKCENKLNYFWHLIKTENITYEDYNTDRENIIYNLDLINAELSNRL